MRILHINTHDGSGGAGRVAMDLMHTMRQRGHDAYLAVGFKSTADSHVVEVPRHERVTPWSRAWTHAAHAFDGRGHLRGVARLQRMLQRLGRTPRQRHRERGFEDIDYPGSWQVLARVPWTPDVVHLHNLHGGYFDLRSLSSLASRVPLFVTLHDCWMLSGHCAHSLDCERWRTGCGQCPDLRIPPAIRRDATHHNWKLKRRVYRRTRFNVATPSAWLMRRVETSILKTSVADARVIPNGVDLGIFKPPVDRASTRAELGLPVNAFIMLASAFLMRRNPWKDHEMLENVMHRLNGADNHEPCLCLVLGEKEAGQTRLGRVEMRYVPYCADPTMVAKYQQAADLYLHPAKADTFPLSVIEALACGVPVIATAVGGIPEQVRSLARSRFPVSPAALGMGGHRAPHSAPGVLFPEPSAPMYGPDEATGILVPAGNADAMAEGITCLAAQDDLRRQLGRNASEDARRRFDREPVTDRYLNWYGEVLESSAPGRHGLPGAAAQWEGTA